MRRGCSFRCACAGWAVAFLLCLAGAARAQAGAADLPVLRVGLQKASPMYKLDVAGNPSGYIVEYLQRLAAAAGWKFDFRLHGSQELMDMLEAGELDIVCGAFPEGEPGAGVAASTEICGTSRQVLFAAAADARLHYEDFAAYSGLKIGLVSDHIGKTLLEGMARKRGFSYTPVFFADTRHLRLALESGAVDAAVSDIHDDLFRRMIAPLGTVPLRLYASSRRPELMARINKVQKGWLAEDPFSTVRFESASFAGTRRVNRAQTRAEAAFVARAAPLRVACGPDNPPELYFDEASGGFKGVYVDLLRLMEQYSGLRFVLIRGRTDTEAVEMLADGRADAYLNAPLLDVFAADHDFVFSRPFWRLHLILVGKAGQAASRYNIRSVAANLEFPWMPYYIREVFPRWNIRYYPAIKECLEAVRAGVCEVTLHPDDRIVDLLVENHYRDIGILSSAETEVPIALALRREHDPLLLSVLNKGIASISRTETMLAEARNKVVPPRFSQLWRMYGNRFELWGLGAAVALLALLGFFQYRIYKVAYEDRLTRLHNQNYFFDKVLGHKRLRASSRKAVAIFEVANLRQINEHYGEEAGNRMLVFVADFLRRRLSPRASLLRHGGDSFLLITPYSRREALAALLNELCESMGAHREGLVSTRLEFNVGVSLTDKDTGIRDAVDMAVFARKRAKAGREKVVFFDEGMARAFQTAKQIEKDMESALEERRFLVYCQPKLDLQTRALAGAEALVRWKIGEGECRSPDEFIPVFEQNGFIARLDFYMLDAVCAMQRNLLDRGLEPCPVSVNQSRVHLGDPEYLAKLKAVLARYDLPGRYIELELTEYTFMEGERILPVLAGIKALGLALSIDDFGSGYSSLNLLRELPIDLLKIDKAFLAESATSEKSRTILRNIVAMSQDLHIDDVCEGVETEEQAAFLLRIGCRYGQGYLFCRPLPAEEYLRRCYGVEGTA